MEQMMELLFVSKGREGCCGEAARRGVRGYLVTAKKYVR